MDSKLKESLQQLHSSIETDGPVDEELHGLLQKLDGDIQLLLAKRAAQEQLADLEDSTTYGLAERSQELSAKFAVKHPKLEPALRELGEILANMGI